MTNLEVLGELAKGGLSVDETCSLIGQDSATLRYVLMGVKSGAIKPADAVDVLPKQSTGAEFTVTESGAINFGRLAGGNSQFGTILRVETVAAIRAKLDRYDAFVKANISLIDQRSAASKAKHAAEKAAKAKPKVRVAA
ncbi:MAG: hypothetical protein SFX18_14360 [Pirellulales bacterium]|nr:hypothetical protein [Pirellulales bacterium]